MACAAYGNGNCNCLKGSLRYTGAAFISKIQKFAIQSLELHNLQTTHRFVYSYPKVGEELDGLSVRSRKLSNVGQSLGDKNLLSRAPSFFGRHVKPLVPTAFAVVSIHSSFKKG
jgi:hypothetical protein